VEAHVSERLAAGQPFDMGFRVVHPDGAVRHVHGSGAFLTGANGAPIRGTGLIRDVTEKWQVDETQRLLLAELDHRVKNMLTVILSIAAQTRLESKSLDECADAFEERVLALAQAHDALTRNGWKGAKLGDLVAAAVGLFTTAQRSRVSVDGPPIELGPSAATTFSLALHELGANALKYGAFSRAAGRVEIGWRIETSAAGDRFVFEWRERDGPAVSPPERRGFGSTLLEEGLAGELDGDGRLIFAPDGFAYRLDAPLSEQVRHG
jgi:two-component sensor histidine kinase